MTFAETKLDETYTDASLNKQGYRLYRKDRTYDSGGGLAIYVSNKIPSKRLSDWEHEEFENIVLELILNKTKVLLISLYRPDSININVFTSSMEVCLDTFLSKYESVIVMGDFNVNLLIESSNSNKINDLCDQFDFENLITTPTCFKKGCKESLIDLILCNQKEKHVYSGVIANGVSDMHGLIYTVLDYTLEEPKPPMITYRSYKSFNQDHFLYDVQQLSDKHVISSFYDINDYITSYKSICDKHAPIKHKFLKKKQSPHINTKYRKAIARKGMLLHKWRKNKTPQNWNNYRVQRNMTSQIGRHSISNYFKSKC